MLEKQGEHMSTDILWYNDQSGEPQIWFMDQNRMISRGTVMSADPSDPNVGNPALVGLPWRIVGVGDFNGNGNADILWYNNDSGEPQIWFMDQNRMISRGTVMSADPSDPNVGNPALVGLPWRIVGVGEFDRLTIASAKIRDFHKSSLGILVVGSPVGPTREVANGSFEQRYEFGSILKPLDGPPVFATRYVATIDIA